MSWGTCYKGTNNIHFNFPALMDDSRIFSTYESSGLSDSKIKKTNGIKTNSDYRSYLQKNADTIIRDNQLNACDNCGTCQYNTKIQSKDIKMSNTPYIFETTLSADQPYGYESSDLKNIYLSRQQLEARMHTPRFQIQ